MVNLSRLDVDRGENNDVNNGHVTKYEMPTVFGKDNQYMLEVESGEAENRDSERFN